MTYEINILDNEGIINVRHFGIIPFMEGQAAQTEVADIVKDSSHRKILVDMREAEMAEPPSTVNLFDQTSSLKNKFPLGTRIAIVYQQQKWPPQDIRFSEDVASNHGVIMKLFDSIDDATAWLKS